MAGLSTNNWCFHAISRRLEDPEHLRVVLDAALPAVEAPDAREQVDARDETLLEERARDLRGDRLVRERDEREDDLSFRVPHRGRAGRIL